MKLKERAGLENEKEVDAMGFGTIEDMKQSILDDMDILKASPYLREDLKVFGILFDIIKDTVTHIKDLQLKACGVSDLVSK
ncbi:hypothetical protein IMSHALPRED_001270 [Imshaugia aleurites]|uniref:Uncharacterized protein n=1 Tax=Imshaugia aleurites TaxID=172621 RepID=A0A8H3J228_9LECA|nr:hypothetical protein IMSHALPRED_001270 [Imshaugia aleurites]